MKKITLVKIDELAILPTQGSEHSACWDLYALEDVEFGPGEIKIVKTGWACEVEEGYRINIYARSSTPKKKGFILANSVGIIDADYRGGLGVQLLNVKNATGRTRSIDGISRETAFLVQNKVSMGDKIAQIELVPDIKAEIEIVDKLSKTKRGKGGFGSTGD